MINGRRFNTACDIEVGTGASDLASDVAPPGDDEKIDLGELFAAIWAHRFPVTGGAVLGLLAAAFYAVSVAVPTYEAKSLFELSEPNNESFGDLGGLASLAGLDVNRGSASEAEKIADRIFSRPFLHQIADSAALYDDPQFNSTIRPPGLTDKVFETLGLSSMEAPTKAHIDAAVAGQFAENVALNVKDNGIVELTVTHTDPERAASVANIVVNQVLQNLYEMRRTQTREKLDYFAEQLLEVRAELDRTVQDLTDYSLANNLRSQEELARSSAQLVTLRDRLEDMRSTLRALERLEELASSGTPLNAQALDALFADYPAASSLEFRRLLGWQGAESSWTLPEPEEIIGIQQNLEDQAGTLVRTIRELEEDAKQNAEAATELETLRREIAVNEAMYEAMLKQFEGESLTSGFALESGQVIDTAVPPVEPSAPRKFLIAAVGMVLGLSAGLVWALIRALRRGILYTRAAVKDAFAISEAKAAHRGLVRRASRDATSRLHALRGKPMRAVEDLLVQIVSDVPERTAVIPCASVRFAINGTLAVADLQRPEQGSLCLVDLSEDGELSRGLGLRAGAEPIELEPGLFVARPKLFGEHGRSAGVNDAIDALSACHERLVLFCPAPEQGTAITQKAIRRAGAVVVLAQGGHTTRLGVGQIGATLSRYAATPAGLLIG